MWRLQQTERSLDRLTVSSCSYLSIYIEIFRRVNLLGRVFHRMTSIRAQNTKLTTLDDRDIAESLAERVDRRAGLLLWKAARTSGYASKQLSGRLAIVARMERSVAIDKAMIVLEEGNTSITEGRRREEEAYRIVGLYRSIVVPVVKKSLELVVDEIIVDRFRMCYPENRVGSCRVRILICFQDGNP